MWKPRVKRNMIYVLHIEASPGYVFQSGLEPSYGTTPTRNGPQGPTKSNKTSQEIVDSKSKVAKSIGLIYRIKNPNVALKS